MAAVCGRGQGGGTLSPVWRGVPSGPYGLSRSNLSLGTSVSASEGLL